MLPSEYHNNPGTLRPCMAFHTTYMVNSDQFSLTVHGKLTLN